VTVLTLSFNFKRKKCQVSSDRYAIQGLVLSLKAKHVCTTSVHCMLGTSGK